MLLDGHQSIFSKAPEAFVANNAKTRGNLKSGGLGANLGPERPDRRQTRCIISYDESARSTQIDIYNKARVSFKYSLRNHCIL